MKRLVVAIVLAACMSLMLASAASAGGPCSPKDPQCPGGGPPFTPPGHELNNPAPVVVSPTNQIVIDVTGAGFAGNINISNSGSGIVIDITGAGIMIDITGVGLANKPF